MHQRPIQSFHLPKLFTLLCFLLCLSLPSVQAQEEANQANTVKIKSYKQVSVAFSLMPGYDHANKRYNLRSIHINGIEFDSGANALEEYDFVELQKLIKEQIAFDKRPNDWAQEDRSIPAPLLLILDPNMSHAQFKRVLTKSLTLSKVMDIRLAGAEPEDFSRLNFDFSFNAIPKVDPTKKPDLPTVPNITRKVRSPTLKKGNPLSDPPNPFGSPSTQPVEHGLMEQDENDPATTQPAPPTPPTKNKVIHITTTQPSIKPRVAKGPPKTKTFVLVFYQSREKAPVFGIKDSDTTGTQDQVVDSLKEMIGAHGYLTADSPIVLKADDQVTMKYIIPLLIQIQNMGYEDIRISQSQAKD